MQQLKIKEDLPFPSLTISRDDVSPYELQTFDNPFFKLDAGKLLELEGITPNRPQMAFINATNCPKYRFIVACISRRLGKTFAANFMATLVWLVPGCNILLVAPDYSLASISWDEQQRIIKKYGVETEVNNSKDRVVHFKNGSMIKVASVGKIDSAVGRSYDFILFDETAIAFDAKDKFEVALRPTLDKEGATAVFISTPRGDNWFKEYYDRGFDPMHPKWCSIHATYHENDRMNEEDVADARKEMTKSKFEQEFLASFVVFEGQIMEAFDEERHVEGLEDYYGLEGVGGLDFGFRDDTAASFIKYDYREEVFYIVDEYVNAGVNTKLHAENLAEKMEEHGTEYFYADPSGAQSRHDLASIYDITTISANNQKLEGIAFLNTLLANDKIKIHPRCRKTIAAFKNYRWDPKAQREKEIHDEHSHIMDAVRYAVYTFGKANMVT